MDWRVFYIMGNLLKHRCLKWVRMTHLDTLNTSYGQKKGRESNCQFDSRPLKIKNRPNFLVCRWCATHHWKALNKGYNFFLDFISIGGLHIKLWAPKVVGVLTLGNLGILGQNDIWVLVLWPSTKYIIRGKVVASPKFKPWWILWDCVYPWLVRTPKCSNYTLTNLLFGLCKSVWVIKLLINFPNPIPEL